MQANFEVSPYTAGIDWWSFVVPTLYYSGITYGNGKFLAIASSSSSSSGTIIYSENGVKDWKTLYTPKAGLWSYVTFGGGKFVSVASAGTSARAIYSEDGINWFTSNLTSVACNCVVYGNDKFVAVCGTSSSKSNIRAYSYDGISWEYSAALPSFEQWYCLAYGNNKFVTFCVSGTSAAYSNDGITWTAVTLPISASWRSIAYGNGTFVAVSNNSSNKALYSFDGITWTETTLPTGPYWNSVTYGSNKFVAIGGSSSKKSDVVAYSYDGITWKSAKMPFASYWYRICYGKDKFCAISYNSSNGAYSSSKGEET